MVMKFLQAILLQPKGAQPRMFKVGIHEIPDEYLSDEHLAKMIEAGLVVDVDAGDEIPGEDFAAKQKKLAEKFRADIEAKKLKKDAEPVEATEEIVIEDTEETEKKGKRKR